MTHKQYERWIERFWKYGAIDVGQRDDLVYRLNIAREDYAAIKSAMEPFARYLPAKSRAAWAAAAEGRA